MLFQFVINQRKFSWKLPTYEQGGPEIELGNFQYTNRVGPGGWVGKKKGFGSSGIHTSLGIRWCSRYHLALLASGTMEWGSTPPHSMARSK